MANDIPGQIRVTKLIYQMYGWIGIVYYGLLAILFLIGILIASPFIQEEYYWIERISIGVAFLIFAIFIGWNVFLVQIGNNIGKRKTWARIAGIVVASLWSIFAIINIITPIPIMLIPIYILSFTVSIIMLALGITVIVCLLISEASTWFSGSYAKTSNFHCRGCGKGVEYSWTKCPYCGFMLKQESQAPVYQKPSRKETEFVYTNRPERKTVMLSSGEEYPVIAKLILEQGYGV